MERWRTLLTEGRHPDSESLDTLSGEEIVELLLKEDKRGLDLALEHSSEILTGSTRLKAGSATKAALNAITTAAMVRLGKTYGNLMVDLRPGSAKLQDRALRIIEAAASVPFEEAEQLHAAANGNVKIAILMGKLEISAFEAQQRLEAAKGHLRRALES